MGDRADADDDKIGPLDATRPMHKINKLWWLCPGWKCVVFGMLITIGALVTTSSWLGARRTPGATCVTRVWAEGRGRRKACFDGAVLLANVTADNEGLVGDRVGDAAGARRAGMARRAPAKQQRGRRQERRPPAGSTLAEDPSRSSSKAVRIVMSRTIFIVVAIYV